MVPTEHCVSYESLNVYYKCDNNFNGNLDYDFTNSQIDFDKIIGTRFDDFHIVESVFSNHNYLFLYGMHRNCHVVLVTSFSKMVTMSDIFEGCKFSIDSVIHSSSYHDTRNIVSTMHCESFDHPNPVIKFKMSNTVEVFYKYIKGTIPTNPHEKFIGNINFYNFLDNHGNVYYRTAISINEYDLQQRGFPSSFMESNELAILERDAENLRM
ncbi:hypothetical protein [Ehrlichia minasensis]|nr:hypothetical protein [Ehrlichia minasensis]